MQYIEDMTDRQAADAVRSRIDWKYALSLELTDPGFDFSVLCEFNTWKKLGIASECLGLSRADYLEEIINRELSPYNKYMPYTVLCSFPIIWYKTLYGECIVIGSRKESFSPKHYGGSNAVLSDLVKNKRSQKSNLGKK
jgi:hypothetical protein